MLAIRCCAHFTCLDLGLIHLFRSRGFGFITFVDPKACEVVMAAGSHSLDSRQIDPKPAVPRGSRSNRAPKPQKQCVTFLFCSGLFCGVPRPPR